MSQASTIASVADPQWELARLECRSCGESLELHQPAVDQPDELLGVCTTCNGWHLVVVGRREAVDLVAFIPRADLIRAARGGRSSER
jgi:hypothetical protein